MRLDRLQIEEAASLGNEARYRAIVDTAVDAIVVINETGIVSAFNPAAERLFGYLSADVMGQNIKLLMPEPYHGEHDGYLSRYKTTGERRIIGIGREVSGRRKDGSNFPLELSIAEWRSGRVRFFTGVMRDVTDRTRAEAHMRLLVNELNHRVKNTLATVQAIAGQTLRNATSIEEARTALTSRLLALSLAHDVLTRESWESAALADIVHTAVALHGEKRRFNISGPAVRIGPQEALGLSMGLHELFTNAVKYGALSVDAGVVDINWALETTQEGRLVLEWKERDGPPVSPPTRKGFGTRLIEAGLPSELGGPARIDYQPAGVVCTMVARLAEDPKEVDGR